MIGPGDVRDQTLSTLPDLRQPHPHVPVPGLKYGADIVVYLVEYTVYSFGNIVIYYEEIWSLVSITHPTKLASNFSKNLPAIISYI